MGKKTVSSTNGVGKIGQLCYITHTRTKLDHFLMLCTKTNSKWIKDLNVRPEIINIFQQSTDRNFCGIDHSNFFLDFSSEARKTKLKINYWDYIKIKSFCTAKEQQN